MPAPTQPKTRQSQYRIDDETFTKLDQLAKFLADRGFPRTRSAALRYAIDATWRKAMEEESAKKI